MKVSSRKVTPTPSVPPDRLQCGRGPRFALDHLGKQSQPDGNDLVVLSQSFHRLVEKGVLILERASGDGTEGLPERRQHLLGVGWTE